MDIEKIPFGTAEAFNAVVEISQGSPNKYEFDEISGMLKLDFVFRDGLVWPTNYGFLPNTLAEDGDPLDVMVISSSPLLPLTLVACKPIGMIEVLDRGEGDNKIIAVPVVDPLSEQYNDLQDLSEEQIRSFEDFYREVAIQKNKIMEIKGFWGNERAMEEIKKSAK